MPERCYKTVLFDARFLARRAPSSTGTLFHSRELEGGGSKAFEIFRDSKYFKWFAEVDSFSSDFVTTDRTGKLILPPELLSHLIEDSAQRVREEMIAETFPEVGAILVGGERGYEVFEYDAKTSSSFRVTARHARTNFAVQKIDGWAGHPHEAGDVVILLGYTAPLVTDLPEELLGLFRML